MGLERFFITPLTITTPGTATDRYDDARPDWTNPTRTRTARGWLTETGSTEEVGAREAVVSAWRLFLPANTPITSSDRITVNGDTFEVDGDPHHAQTPSGAHHLEVPLRKIAE